MLTLSHHNSFFFFFLPFVLFLSLWLSLSGSREAAFVYAISSAGVVYALTRACSQGELKTCNCDPHKRGRDRDERGEFDWGGCSDYIHYGIKFAKAFIDAKERTGRDARALMNLHNNRCGRTVSVQQKNNRKQNRTEQILLLVIFTKASFCHSF